MITPDRLRNRFATFNALYFGGTLPEPQFAVSNSRTVLGRFSCRRQRGWLFGRSRFTDYMIKVSGYYDIGERECDNILLHEMIHLYIAHSGLRDTSPHGPLFRREMERLNAFGHGIGVTTDTKRWTVAERNRRTAYNVLALTTADGRRFLSVVSPAYVGRVDRMAARQKNIASRRWYVSSDSFFASFPMSRSLRARPVSQAEFDRITAALEAAGTSAAPLRQNP